MSFVTAVPATLAAAAGALRNVPVNTAAVYAEVGKQTFVIGPGIDMVSRAVEKFFGAHAEDYRQISAAAEVALGQFADYMSNAANQYSITEATNTTTLD